MLPSHQRALDDIADCMTAAMGGGRYRCHDCDDDFWSYHGCRHRSCPKCHGRQMADWLQTRTVELLPCDYFHVVATVPAELRPLCLRHQKLVYGLLMTTAAEALRDLAAEARYVGAQVGILAVLHTWNGALYHHPHVHLRVTGGGVSDDGTAWHDAANGFLVPVKKLSPMIAQRFAHALRQHHPELFDQVPAEAWKRPWCTYCKPCGNGRDAVLGYLARYVFRIALTNARLLAMDDTHVTFRYQVRHTGAWKTERLDGVAFLRRFLLHVLPKGFHKVRYYGLWHPAQRPQQAQARLLLQRAQPAADAPQPLHLGDVADDALRCSDMEAHGHQVKCPRCGGVHVSLLLKLPHGATAMAK
jgi:Zn finger protein HypA/HybF involved in hydrogenase expression